MNDDLDLSSGLLSLLLVQSMSYVNTIDEGE